MAADDKVVIGQTHGSDDPEAVLIGYLSGSRRCAPANRSSCGSPRTASTSPPTAIPTASRCPARRPSKTSTPNTWRKAAASSPVPYVSRRGLESAAWVKGAEVKGAPSLYEFTEGGALTFNY